MDVAAWLQSLGLERYAEAFAANDINADVLPELTAEDLIGLGVTSIGHRRRLLAAIAALHAGTAPSAGSSTDARFAPAAGAATASQLPEAELRQVTVLFCDLAGYTKLTHEVGAETMHALTDRFFELADGVIERFGGSVDKHIGDCVMGVFGAPVAHGNDPERAVRAALAIRDAVPALGTDLGRPLDVHIGIASGQVVASSGSGYKTYAVTGDSVNLAARLTDAAGAGTILISEAVRRLLGGRLMCEDVGALSVRGLEGPVRAWRLERFDEPKAMKRPPFVGRHAELHQLESALRTCLETGSGQAVYVRGEAGIGKTRLVEETQKRAEGLGFKCHVGLVLDFGMATGQDAIRSIVRSLTGLAPATGQQEVAAAAESVMAAGLLDQENRVFLNDLLDLPQPTDLRALYDAMDNATRNRGKRATLAQLITGLSLRQPQLVIVEDLHWAEPLTLAHLARLASTVAASRVMLIMTSRTEGDPLDATWRSRTAGSPLLTLDLGPLRDAEAQDLAAAYLDASAEFARRCLARAAGNPLFLEQLLRHAGESAESRVPGSVQSLVQARMDQLDPSDKRALQAASVFGQRFALDALRHLLDDPSCECARLVANYLIRPQGDEYLFAHALIRDGVYDSLLRARRRELHRKAAGWFKDLDLVLYAEHLDRAEDEVAPRAYLAAAQAEASRYHYERALRLMERGLDLASLPADRSALTCLRGDLLHDLGDMREAIAAYGNALAAARLQEQRCRALIGLAAVKRVTEDLDGAFADLAEAEAAAAGLDLMSELARIHFLRGNLYFPKGDISGCLAEHEKSLELAELAGSAELQAAALGGLGDAEYVRGRMITAHRRFRECVELCRAHGFGRIEVANSSMVAHSALYFRPQEEALGQALASAEAAVQVGHLRAELNAQLAAFFALFEMAELERVKEQVARAQELVRRLGAWRFEPVCLLYLSKVALAEGRRVETVDLLNRALAISRETGVSFVGPWILGHIAVATGGPGRAS